MMLLGLGVAMPLVLAHRSAFPLEAAMGQLDINLVSSLFAGNAVDPLPNDDKTLADGGDLFANDCSNCHGEKGDGQGKFVGRYFPACRRPDRCQRSEPERCAVALDHQERPQFHRHGWLS